MLKDTKQKGRLSVIRQQNSSEKRRATQHAHINKKASNRNDGKENLRLLFTVHDAVKVACFEGGAWGVVLLQAHQGCSRGMVGAALKIMKNFLILRKNVYVQKWKPQVSS